MPKIKIIAHAMHEYELGAAIQNPNWSTMEVTESFVVGEFEESQIGTLEDAGLIVQRLTPPADLQSELSTLGTKRRILASPPKMDQPGIEKALTRGAGFLEAMQAKRGEPGVREGYFRLQVSGPLMESRKEDLTRLGAEVIELLDSTSFLARIPANTSDKVAELSWVESIQEDRGQAMLPLEEEIARARSGPVSGNGTVTYDILLREPEALPSVRAWLEERNIHIVGTGESKIRIVLPEDSPHLDEIRLLPEVEEPEPWIPPKLHNDHARVLMGMDFVRNPSPVLSFPLEGEGELIAVADTGIDDSHPDFQGRIQKMVGLGRPGITDDPNGHGTHVAGSVLGDGSSSSPAPKGVAPKAKLYFQSLLDSVGRLGGLPVDLKDLFDPPYQAGARVHNNSWGAVAGGSYRANSREVDKFVHDNRDMVIVFSAGNDGTASEPLPPDVRTSQTGYVNWKSVGAPASAKNCITVGASRSDRTTGGYSSMTYGAAWPQDFPDTPIRDEKISGDPQGMAGFSSRGPTDDYRIKPEVTGPGTDILSCKSALAPVSKFWGPHSQHYAYNGGTSMSAPLVAGCAALVREYYQKRKGHAPSAALVKATLINGTRWLGGQDSTADHPAQPNFHQGFGAIDMSRTIPVADSQADPPEYPRFHLNFIDNWKDSSRHLAFTGNRHRYQFSLDSPGELRICLAYTDLPARALQNNLNLFLQMLPFSSRKWNGNQHLPFSLGGPDTTNNVEVIRLPNAQPGDYLIQVTAQNLPWKSQAQGAHPWKNLPQDYALVVTSAGSVSSWTVLD